MIKNITAPLSIGQASANYTLKGASGFGSANVEVVKWNRPGFHGVKTPKSFWRERALRLIIGVRADSSATYETKRRDLEASFDTPHNGLTLLQFVTQGGLALQSYFQLSAPIQAPFNPGEVTIGNFRIELVAEDPVLYSQTETTTEITFTAGSGTVTNGGNSPVYPTVRIYGEVTNPGLVNTTLGLTLSFSGLTIAAGHYIEIDMLNETIKYDGSTNYYSYVNSDDFSWLKVGANAITVSGTVGSSGDRLVRFYHHNGYIGI